MSTWILIADASQARIFASGLREAPWTLVKELDNPQGRLASHEIHPSSPPGRMQESKDLGARRSSMEPHTTPKEAAGERFAHELAELIEAARNHVQFERLVLVAPPHFLGVLRGLLSGPSAARVTAAVDKDLVAFSAAEVRERLLDVAFPQ